MRLGCGEATAYITGKCGTPRIGEFVDASSIYWERVLDDISEATVTIPIGGSGGEACCRPFFADIEPFCHELHITRNGVVEWMGPVTGIRYGYNEVKVQAMDVAHWLTLRVNEGDIDYTTTGLGPAPLEDIAEDVIQTALAEDDPCVLPYIIKVPSGLTGQRFFPAYGGPTAFDDLESLSNTGLNYTVVRRSIILSGEEIPGAAIGVLTDEMIMGDIEVTKDGDLMANRWFVRYTDDDDEATCTAQGAPTPCPAVADGAQECYGLVERIRENTDGIPDVVSAQETAVTYLGASRIAPRTIVFNPGTRISPETPFDIPVMIPGQRIDVALTGLCFPIYQAFRLQKVAVQYQRGGDEEVSLTLSAQNLIT